MNCRQHAHAPHHPTLVEGLITVQATVKPLSLFITRVLEDSADVLKVSFFSYLFILEVLHLTGETLQQILSSKLNVETDDKVTDRPGAELIVGPSRHVPQFLLGDTKTGFAIGSNS